MSTTTIDANPSLTGRGWDEDSAHFGVMAPAARALGMTSNDLRNALRAGHSFGSLAASRGVSAPAMRDALRDALTLANPGLAGERCHPIVQRLLEGPRAARVAL